MKVYIATLFERTGGVKEADMPLFEFKGIKAESEEEARKKLFSQVVRIEFEEITEEEWKEYLQHERK